MKETAKRKGPTSRRREAGLTPTPKLVAILRRFEREYARGDYYGPFATAADMIAHLHRAVAKKRAARRSGKSRVKKF